MRSCPPAAVHILLDEWGNFHGYGFHILLLSEVGNMINSIDVNLKTTDYGGVAQPAGEPSVSPTENFFLRILEEAGLAHINVTANPPYVALFDGLNRRAAMRC